MNSTKQERKAIAAECMQRLGISPKYVNDFVNDNKVYCFHSTILAPRRFKCGFEEFLKTCRFDCEISLVDSEIMNKKIEFEHETRSTIYAVLHGPSSINDSYIFCAVPRDTELWHSSNTNEFCLVMESIEDDPSIKNRVFTVAGYLWYKDVKRQKKYEQKFRHAYDWTNPFPVICCDGKIIIMYYKFVKTS